MKFNNNYNDNIINATLVQAVLDQQNSEAANCCVRLTKKFLLQCTPPPLAPPHTTSCWSILTKSSQHILLTSLYFERYLVFITLCEKEFACMEFTFQVNKPSIGDEI